MNTDRLFHRETAHVRGYDVTSQGIASIPAIIQMLHEAAMQHVLRLKMSAVHLAPSNLGWALHQQSLQVLSLPKLGDRLQVLTHPSGLEKLLTYRDFQLFDQDEKLLASASTSWFLMNLQRRRVVRYPDSIKTVIEPSSGFEHLPRPVSPDENPGTPLAEHTFQVLYHDLDFNGHLSNYHYAKWMLDAVPALWWSERRIVTFDIQFLAECLLNDSITITVTQINDDTVSHRMTKEGKTVALGTTKWHNSANHTI